MQIQFDSKAALLDALKAKLPEVREYDKALTAGHRANEKQALENYRAKLRAELKKPYSALVTQHPRWGTQTRYIEIEPPACPTLLMPRAKKIIDVYSMTQQSTFKIGDTGMHSEAYWLLTFDPNPPAKTPCG